MSKNITIHVEQDGLFELFPLVKLIDIEKVEFYSVKLQKDNTILIKFYDKKKKLVRPHAKNRRK